MIATADGFRPPGARPNGPYEAPGLLWITPRDAAGETARLGVTPEHPLYVADQANVGCAFMRTALFGAGIPSRRGRGVRGPRLIFYGGVCLPC